MSGFGDRRTLLLFAVVLWLLVLLAALVPAGFLNIDEFLYYWSAEAFRMTGGFVVENGHDRFASEDLRLWLLVEGPNGLVPQYPVGTAVLGAPLVAIFGPKGLIVLNLLAGVGTLFAAHALARRLFEAPQVAMLSVTLLAFCTFWAEYVVGYWPHSVSIFTTTLALWLFLGALDLPERA